MKAKVAVVGIVVFLVALVGAATGQDFAACSGTWNTGNRSGKISLLLRQEGAGVEGTQLLEGTAYNTKYDTAVKGGRVTKKGVEFYVDAEYEGEGGVRKDTVFTSLEYSQDHSKMIGAICGFRGCGKVELACPVRQARE